MMPATLVLLANGSEEMEAVIIIDVLRRACWPVTVAATGDCLTITASRGVRLTADALLADLDPSLFDLLILPGGKGGTDAFAADPLVLSLLHRFNAEAKQIAAICAAPLALHAAGILLDRQFTCYPGTERAISSGQHCDRPVVHDQNLTTSQGPGTAFAFALALVDLLENKLAAENLRRQMILS